MAITTALQAFEENWGGFRDALSWLTRTELPSFSEALEDTAGKSRRLNDELQAIGDQFGLSASQVYELKEMTKLYNEELDNSSRLKQPSTWINSQRPTISAPRRHATLQRR